MVLIPHYVLYQIPVLTVWWVHRRGALKEYRLLAASALTVSLGLLACCPSGYTFCTYYGAPLSASGIFARQLPLSIFVAALLAAIPVRWRFVRNSIAILTGEILLLDTWVS